MKERKPKRRIKGEGSLLRIYGRKDPITGRKKLASKVWFAQYRHNGRTVRVSTGETGKMKAAAKLRQFMAARDSGLEPGASKLRYADLRRMLIDNYREKENRTLTVDADGEETVHGLKQLDRFFSYGPNNPGPRVSELTAQTSQDFARKRRQDGVGNAIINRGLACLRRMLRIAHDDNRIQHVPKVHFLKEPPARKGWIEKKKFDELVKSLPTHLRPLVIFLYYCGARIGEALQVEWHQVDLDARLITFTQEQTKTKEDRIVPIPSELVMLLKEIEPKTGKVFSATNLRVEWQRACAACGQGTRTLMKPKKEDGWAWYRYRGLSIHDLRRSAVRNLVRAGVPETIAMAISGHKTRAVFDRYNITSTADVTAAMSRLELAPAQISESLVKDQLPKKQLRRVSHRK